MKALKNLMAKGETSSSSKGKKDSSALLIDGAILIQQKQCGKYIFISMTY